MRKRIFAGFQCLLAFGTVYFSMSLPVSGQTMHTMVADTARRDSIPTDSIKYEEVKGLPLKPSRHLPLNTTEGTWMSVDVSPDGQTIAFDLMGDIYMMPIGGGEARQVTKGIAFDTHPRFSPDGKKLLFTSDRSGSENLWYIDFEKKDTFQLTKERDQNFPAAAWTPDGNYVVYAKGRLLIQLYMIHKNGGPGVQLTEGDPSVKAIDPAVSADGRYVYYSRRNGPWQYNAQLPQYQIGTYDRQNGKGNVITSRYGSAFTPVLSKDGKWLVYGTRYEDKTGLVLRDLATGVEKWLAYPVQRDEQESIATMGVLPGMSFTPDSKALVASYGGKIYRIPVDGSAPQELAFQVHSQLELGPRLAFKFPVKDTSYLAATQIRNAVPSPDGKRLAFTALNRLYVMDYPNGSPRRVTTNEFTEAQPAWSPDGKALVFVSWSKGEGGYLYKADLAGRKAPVRLTQASGLYQSPVFNNEGDRIVFIRSSVQSFKNAFGPEYNSSEDELCWIPANGGTVTLIERAMGRDNPHFVKGDHRIYLSKDGGELVSIQWDGSDEKSLAKITGITTYGISVMETGRHAGVPSIVHEEDAAPMEVNKPSTAGQINLSPAGDRVLAQINNELYVINMPRTGKVVNLNVADIDNATFPALKLTEFGGEFPYWEADGKRVHYSLGSTHFVYSIDMAEAFNDSVRMAKVKADLKKGDTAVGAKKDSTGQVAAKETPRYRAEQKDIKVYYANDIPQSSVLLKGARVITMRGEEVLEKGDILIEKNRIAAIGASGSVTVPSGTKVMDMSGKTIMPGFVDVHSHMWPNWGVHKNQIWIYAANLAYGVTTTRDPQTSTTDVLTYGDMVNAGKMVGPRIYSTGPGVGFWAYNIKDSAQAEDVLKQYSNYYHTHYIKMYLTGNRQQRQWIIMAARNQQLMPTTEGGLNYKLNMTNLLDGYPGHEHAIPVYPLYGDVIKSIAASGMIVTPTLLVAYGGPWAENYFYETEKPYHDAKLQYFTPYEELAMKSRRRSSWFMDEEHVFQKHAKSMKALVEAKGLAGIGSHGQLQGLGYHWEMWAMQSGGMRPIDVLRTATIFGATGLGLNGDLGSIEQGKLADLVILDQNPLENIRNTNTIHYVMKNGRMYEGNTLNEVYPEQRVLDRSEFLYDKPAKTTNVEE